MESMKAKVLVRRWNQGKGVCGELPTPPRALLFLGLCWGWKVMLSVWGEGKWREDLSATFFTVIC